jgi:hypothetical protein
MDEYSKPGLVIFGDSVGQISILPNRLNPTTINFGLGGVSPVENYFFLKRMLRDKVHPKAVLLSFCATHFVLDDLFLARGVLFGLLNYDEANEVLTLARKIKDKDFIADPGLWGLENRFTLVLGTLGFPAYYTPSVLAAHFNRRLSTNTETLQVIPRRRGQYYFTDENVPGSRNLSLDANFSSFKTDPVIDYYFGKTLDLLESTGIPCYFAVQPTNDVSAEALKKNGFLDGLKNYLRRWAQTHKQFHPLSDLEPVYSWEDFADGMHMNGKGSEKFSRQLAVELNKARAPGGPYGVNVP